MRQAVLILGGGVMQLPAIRIAKRKGWYVYVADGNQSCPGAAIADSLFPIDLKEIDRLIEAARTCDPRLTGVFTAGTDFSAAVARIAGSLGLPGTSYESAQNASDKARMRRRFAEAGVPSPGFVEICETEEAGALVAAAALKFPLVVKPVDNMGARGVRRISDPAGVVDAVRSAVRFSRTGRAIVEEFIPGTEYSLDAIVQDGKVTVCGLAERHIYFPPAFVEMGHTIPAEIDSRTTRDLVEVFAAGVRALGISGGAAKGDIFHTGQGAVVGEIAARLSGGYMSGWTFPYASGIEVTEAALNIAVGLPAGDLASRRNWVSAERAFLSIPGIVAGVNGVAAARNIPGVKDVFLRVDTGMEVTFPANNVEKSGNVIACASSRAEAVRAAQYALRCIEIRLEPNVSSTDSFLFSAGARQQPGVLELSEEDDLRTLRELQLGEPDLDLVSSEVSSRSGGPVRLPEILPLPRWEQEDRANWAGITPAEAVRTCLRRHGLTMAAMQRATGRLGRPRVTEKPQINFSALFWTALLRGGVQGVDYFIDSLAARMPYGVAASGPGTGLGVGAATATGVEV